MAMNAMHHHLPSARQVLPPPLELIGVAMHGGDDELAGLGEVGGAANVHHDRRRRGAEPAMKIGRGHRRKSLFHDVHLDYLGDVIGTAAPCAEDSSVT